MLKTVKRLRNGIACASSPVSAARRFRRRNETVGVDDGGAVLALADMAAKRERLAEGEPALAGEPALDRRRPRGSGR